MASAATLRSTLVSKVSKRQTPTVSGVEIFGLFFDDDNTLGVSPEKLYSLIPTTESLPSNGPCSVRQMVRHRFLSFCVPGAYQSPGGPRPQYWIPTSSTLRLLMPLLVKSLPPTSWVRSTVQMTWVMFRRFAPSMICCFRTCDDC